MSNKLMEQIDALVAEKTFSLDAVNAITAMRNAVIDLEEEVRVLTSKLDLERKAVAQRDQLNKELGEKLQHAQAAQKEAEKAAEAYRKQGIEGQCAVAELKGYAAALQTIFKPSVVRETVQKTVPIPVLQGGYTSIQPHSEFSNIERSAE